MEDSVINLEEIITEYPFLNYVNEDKSHYKHAKDAGYEDPDDLFLIGDSGGFLLNIHPGDKFVNTELFSKMAEYYKTNKCYTKLKVDSIEHRKLRKREELRRRNGFTAPCLLRNGIVQNVRITGHHYNFLNYVMMEQLDESAISTSSKNSVAKKHRTFSKFIDAQFWTFHVIEFAKNNGLHLIIDKTRRGGFSYIMASKSSNTLNLQPHKVVIHVADDKKYLTADGGLTDFTIKNLEFYEQTGLFKRGIYSTNAEKYSLGFRNKNGSESTSSWSSALLSVSANRTPNCAIGKDAIDVSVEEVSTMENFDDFMTVTDPAMRTGSYVTGNLCCWGTATANNMQAFEKNFYNPDAYHFMAFENVWDKDSRNTKCGYFKSYVWGLQGKLEGKSALDKDGNSDMETAIRIAYRERHDRYEHRKTFADYINYLGQHAMYPSESFSSTTENIFSSPELMKWEERLRTDNSFNIYSDGQLIDLGNKVEFKTNKRIKEEGGIYNKDYYDWIEGVPRKDREHPHGCIRLWFHPMKVLHKGKDGMTNGTPPGLYSISYDPVGISKETKNITLRNSHNSIKVWMNPSKYNNFKTALVAAYYGRPETLEEADKICLLLAKYYNCIGTTGVEINRGETVSNFKKWGALRYLMKDPVNIWDSTIKGNIASSYGVNMGSEAKKLEGLRLLKEMLYSVIGKDSNGDDMYLYQTIYDYQSILELKKWNPMGNYDRVSEMIIRAIQWQLNNTIAAKELEQRKKMESEEDDIMSRAWF